MEELEEVAGDGDDAGTGAGVGASTGGEKTSDRYVDPDPSDFDVEPGYSDPNEGDMALRLAAKMRDPSMPEVPMLEKGVRRSPRKQSTPQKRASSPSSSPEDDTPISEGENTGLDSSAAIMTRSGAKPRPTLMPGIAILPYTAPS